MKLMPLTSRTSSGGVYQEPSHHQPTVKLLKRLNNASLHLSTYSFTLFIKPTSSPTERKQNTRGDMFACVRGLYKLLAHMPLSCSMFFTGVKHWLSASCTGIDGAKLPTGRYAVTQFPATHAVYSTYANLDFADMETLLFVSSPKSQLNWGQSFIRRVSRDLSPPMNNSAGKLSSGTSLIGKWFIGRLASARRRPRWLRSRETVNYY